MKADSWNLLKGRVYGFIHPYIIRRVKHQLPIMDLKSEVLLLPSRV